jgi:16S rRNA (guanine966-N2)-methyltransferase
VREATFSMLDSLGVLDGAWGWDLFAGSGALGIEALSRGAAHFTFVDHARAAVAVAQANLSTLGYGRDRGQVVCADVLAWAGRLALPGTPAEGAALVSLVFADPPYAWAEWPALLGLLAPRGPVVVMETGSPPDLGPAWDQLRCKRYGSTVVTVARLLREDRS